MLGAFGAAVFLRRVPAPAKVAAPVAEPEHYSTSRGQYATVRLADGTQVTLAPQTKLTVSGDYGRTERAVSLVGEAVFDVRHDPTRAFRVRAGQATIEDIGTRFDLRAYKTDRQVTVAVEAGAVTLSPSRADSARALRDSGAIGLVLRAGDVGTLDFSGSVSSTHRAAASRYLSWTHGRLSFVSQPLPDVLATIGRWYDLEFRVPDKALAERLVTGEFSTQSASEMIDALAIAVDASVERAGRVVTLRPR